MSKDPNEEYRRLIRERQASIKRSANLREFLVAQRYIVLGYRILSVGDEETRQRFGIPSLQPAADIVVSNRPNTCIIAEVKGTDIDKAIRQLDNTAPYVRREFPFIEPKIFVSSILSNAKIQPLGAGYQALKVYPGEYLLADATGNKVTLRSGEAIVIVFGP